MEFPATALSDLVDRGPIQNLVTYCNRRGIVFDNYVLRRRAVYLLTRHQILQKTKITNRRRLIKEKFRLHHRQSTFNGRGNFLFAAIVLSKPGSKVERATWNSKVFGLDT